METDQMTVPPMSRETRESFTRGFETGVRACILIFEDRHDQVFQGMVDAMRGLMTTKVPRA